MMKGSRWTHEFPFLLPRFQPGATLHPSAMGGGFHSADQLWAAFTQTFGNRAVNEIKGGYGPLHFDFDMYGRAGQAGQPRAGRRNCAGRRSASRPAC